MWPQIISSLAAGVALLVAAALLHSPISALALAFICMLAWASHAEIDARYRNGLTLVGLGLGVLLWFYLLYLASQGAF